MTGLQDKYAQSTANVKRGDIIRLRNVALSYTLPQNICQMLHMKNAKLTAQANNLWFWCAAGSDVDSEKLSTTGAWVVPTLPSYLLKLNVEF